MVIILSQAQDAHLKFVTEHLDSTDSIRIDAEDIVAGKELSFQYEHGNMTVWYDGRRLQNITGVWFRRPHATDQIHIPVEAAHRAFSESALQAQLNMLGEAFRDACWLSRPAAIRRANNKLLQAEVAHSLGFHVPDTIFTSDAQRAQTFIAEHEAVVTKKLSAKYIGQDSIKQFYTSRIDKRKLPDFSGLRVAPTIFQEAIAVATELRITVVGRRVFAASVHPEATLPNHIRDWRAAQSAGSVRYEAFELPKAIASKCIAHCKALGLNFGAIDMIIDTQGKYWFIENNPNGQWAFVDDGTVDQIAQAIASLLQGKAEPLVSRAESGVY